MKRIIISTALLGSLCLGAVTAQADSHGMSAMQLAEKKQCMACHTTGNEMPSAPSFPSIAQRYTMDEFDRLVTVVMSGGEDHWGSAEMPEMEAQAVDEGNGHYQQTRPEVSQEEAKRLVTWILEMRE